MLPRQAISATHERTRNIKESQPPTDLVMSLTSLYFRHIHPWFPFLDLQRVCADMGSMDEPSLLYYALFGVSLPYSFDSRLNQVSSDSFWKYSKRRIFVDVLEEPSYSSLEVLTVLVLDLSGMTHGPQVWGALAAATRLGVQLRNTDGLVIRTSTAAASNESLSDSDRVFRQRLFWAIYSLDCYICITTDHTSTLSDEHVEYFLPARRQVWCENALESSEATPTPASVFSYQLELFDLSRTVHKVAVRYMTLQDEEEVIAAWLIDFQNISSQLGAWIQTLPPRLLWNESVTEQPLKSARPALFMLHGYFHGLMIYLSSLMAVPAHGSLQSEAHSEIRLQCQQRCMRSVDLLNRVVRKATNQISDKLGWPFAWSVWIAARCLVAFRFTAGSSEPQTTDTLALFVGFLDRMGRFWQISSTYARLLRQAISELSQGTIPEQASVLGLMADMRAATCNLEDQSRPDPMLHGTVVRSQSAPNYEYPYFMDVERANTLLSVFPQDICFDMAQQTSDNWFRVPLFASSAYQQFSAPDMG